MLIVDHDVAARTRFADFLALHAFEVATAGGAREMDALLADAPADVVVLDSGLTDESALAVCRRLGRPPAPGLFLISAAPDEADRIVALELGADDYLAKTLSPRELLARIRAFLRRREAASEPVEERLYRFLNWELDLARRELRRETGARVDLSPAEFAVLAALAERPLTVLSRDQLFAASRQGADPSYDRAVDVQISRLRRKLGLRSGDDAGEVIRTVRNEGYMLAVKVSKS